MKKTNIVNILALLSLQMLSWVPWVNGSDISIGMQYQYTQDECGELLQTMIFLSCKRDQPLQERMSQLDPYHNLLLQTWLASGVREVLMVSNSIGSASSFVLFDNHPDEYKEWTEAFNTTLCTYTDRPLTNSERLQQFAYWDKLAEADLQLVKEHIGDHIHSLAFICGSLKVVMWPWTSPSEKEKSYKSLTSLFYGSNEPQLRRSIMRARFFFYNKHPEMFEQSTNDSDIHISQFCLYCLVAIEGNSEYLQPYVRQSWSLFDKNVESDKFIIPVETNVHSLLADLIPNSGSLTSEQSQLNWLGKHERTLVWNEHKHIYEIRSSK